MIIMCPTGSQSIVPKPDILKLYCCVQLLMTPVLAQSIIIPPTDVAGGAGDDVTLTCRVDATTQTQWRVHISTEEEVTISSNNQTLYPEKYEVANRYDLQVKNLNSSDGGFYACLTIGLTGQKRSAKILMFEYPLINFAHPLVENIPTNVTCTSTFYTVRDLDQTEWPDVMVSINGDDLSGSELAVTESHTLIRQSKYEATRIFEYVPRLADLGSQVLCTVNTMAPINYTTTYKFTLNQTSIQYGARNISVLSSGDIFDLEAGVDVLTCLAAGNPPPSVEWEAVDSPLDGPPQKGAELFIEHRMCGNVTNSTEAISNTWRCTADNGVLDVDGNEIIASTIITFQINAASCTVSPTPSTPVITTSGQEEITTTLSGGIGGPNKLLPAVIVFAILLAISIICLVWLFIKYRRLSRKSGMHSRPHSEIRTEYENTQDIVAHESASVQGPYEHMNMNNVKPIGSDPYSKIHIYNTP